MTSRSSCFLFLFLLCASCASAPSATIPIAPTPAEQRPSNAGTVAEGPSSPGPTDEEPEAAAGTKGTEADRSDQEVLVNEGEKSLPLPPDTKVLHIGDSFAGALGLPLGDLLKQQGVRSVLKHTDSSYLTDWAWNGSLQKLIWTYNPDLVVITLGANELAIAQPEQRKRTVKKIVSQLGERPCLWIAIPLWDGKHNGLMDVIEQNVGPCVFMDTNELIDVAQMPRMRDGIHPTTAARKEWASFVMGWLVAHRAPEAEKPWALSLDAQEQGAGGGATPSPPPLNERR